jgi:succinate dehydrogenase / fumarate reductase iron-sulfur subunit
MPQATFKIWRGQGTAAKFVDYTTEFETGMVVLDVVHRIQAAQANDMAVRWNCKAGKCGSCSAEINGRPRLMCMTRMNDIDTSAPVTVQPMHTFPHVKDLVTDVSWNYRVKEKIKPFKPRKPDAPDGTWRMDQADVDRVQEFRKCIECFLCQDVCRRSARSQSADQFINRALFIRRRSRDEPCGHSRIASAIGATVVDRTAIDHQALHQGMSRRIHNDNCMNRQRARRR